jgi:UDP-N-acetyl-2-amino-2-deoxyglucuronate dehydrogenase
MSTPVKIGGQALNHIEHWDFADESPDDTEVEQASYQTTSVYGFGHPPYCANVLDALQARRRPCATAERGCAAWSC